MQVNCFFKIYQALLEKKPHLFDFVFIKNTSTIKYLCENRTVYQ